MYKYGMKSFNPISFVPLSHSSTVEKHECKVEISWKPWIFLRLSHQRGGGNFRYQIFAKLKNPFCSKLNKPCDEKIMLAF